MNVELVSLILLGIQIFMNKQQVVNNKALPEGNYLAINDDDEEDDYMFTTKVLESEKVETQKRQITKLAFG